MTEQTEGTQVDPALQALLDQAIAEENEGINAAVRTHLQQRVVATSVQIRQLQAQVQNLTSINEALSNELEETKKKLPKQPTDRQPRKAAAKKSTVTPIKK